MASRQQLSDEEFAKKAVWLPDGRIMYDFTFTEEDVREVALDDEPCTVEAALSGFLITPKERRDTEPHVFATEFFNREVASGFGMDYFLADEDVGPTYRLVKCVDGKCTLQAVIPLLLVEHWVFKASCAHYSDLLKRGVKLSQKERNALVKLLQTYSSQLEVVEYMDYCDDVIGNNHDVDLELVLRELRLPYVPAAWYMTRFAAAKERKERAKAQEEAERKQK